jgi:hypothetical protein
LSPSGIARRRVSKILFSGFESTAAVKKAIVKSWNGSINWEWPWGWQH